MQAVVQSIESNDTCDWVTFATRTPTDPWKGYGWFTVAIGPEGSEGADLFQVIVCTPASQHHVTEKGEAFRGLLVDSFDPESIKQAISAFVSSVSGESWEVVIPKLQSKMLWEFEGMG